MSLFSGGDYDYGGKVVNLSSGCYYRFICMYELCIVMRMVVGQS